MVFYGGSETANGKRDFFEILFTFHPALAEPFDEGEHSRLTPPASGQAVTTHDAGRMIYLSSPFNSFV